MIVLVTGSRDWANVHEVGRVLLAVTEGQRRETITVRHGAAKGADMIVHVLAQWFGMAVDPMPADWSRGSKAGPERNRAMVAKTPVPDCCLAFIKNRSAGATGCANLAERVGIPTMRIRDDDAALTPNTSNAHNSSVGDP